MSNPYPPPGNQYPPPPGPDQQQQYYAYGQYGMPPGPGPQQPPPQAGYNGPPGGPAYPQGDGNNFFPTGYGQQGGYNAGYGTGPQHPQGPGYQATPSDQAFAIPGLNAPALNPVGVLLNGSNLFAGGQGWGQKFQQGVQQRMGWLSGGALNHQFAISNSYVRQKLTILFLPFLKQFSFSRQAEQIQGSHKYRPPRMDNNAPDLYIPLVAAWTYVTLLCVNAILLGKYKPDIVYSKVWYTGCAWTVHCIAAWIVLRMMSLPTSLPWGELIAYTGYIFVPASCTVLAGMTGVRWAWWCAWAYGSFTSAVFLVRTIKRVLFQEARSYGPNLTLTNYLLLALAVLQFPLMLWLCNMQLPSWASHSSVAAASPSIVKAAVRSPVSIKGTLMSGSSPVVASKLLPPPLKP